MTVAFFILIPSIVSFLVVAKMLPKDWAAAEKLNNELTNN